MKVLGGCGRISRPPGREPKVERGQSVAELALLLPILVLLLAAVDFARLYYTWMAVTDAARVGAQYGAQSQAAAADVAGMEQAACGSMQDIPCAPGTNAIASSFCQCSGATVSCSNPGPCTYLQHFVQVTTNASFSTVVPYPGIPKSVPISARVTMLVQ